MRPARHRAAGLALALAVAGALAATAAGAFDWVTSLDLAKNRARAEGKLLLVDFWAAWCGPCLTMDAKTWTRPDVQAATRRFVCVRSDFGEQGTTISEFYRVESIPMLLVTDASGRVLQRISGNRAPADLVRILAAVPERVGEIDSLAALASRPAADPEASLALLAALSERSLDELGAPVLKALRASSRVKKDPVLKERVELRSAIGMFRSDPGRALEALATLLKKYPSGPARRETYAAVVRLCAEVGARDLARQALSEMKSEFPDDSLTRVSEGLVAELDE